MDDSFLEIVGESSMDIVEINHGKVMGSVDPKVGRIIAANCTRSVTLFAV